MWIDESYKTVPSGIAQILSLLVVHITCSMYFRHGINVFEEFWRTFDMTGLKLSTPNITSDLLIFEWKSNKTKLCLSMFAIQFKIEQDIIMKLSM